MRGVGTPAMFGPFLGAPDAPAGAPNAPGTAGGHDEGGRALPFAAVLATRLVTPKSGAAGPSLSGDPASEPDDDQTDADAAPADATAGPLEVLAAVATAMTVPAATTAGVRHVSRDANALAPALRERLGRVVARMQREYGHDVRIAEAGRTQARQDYLFAQGRTRSGPVVTWTRDSAHTRGRAVDVTLDGGYDNAAAFARLQQIAQAEGLHTLGARDPGHLELPHDVPGEVPALSLGDGGPARVTVESFGVRTEPGTARPPVVAPTGTASPGVAAVAPVAQVAAVAGVAKVATVASVAAPGSPEPGAERGADHGADHGANRDVTRARPSHARTAGAEDPAPVLPLARARASDGARSGGEGERSDEHAPDHGGDARDARVGSPIGTEAAPPTTAPASAGVGAAAPGTAAPAPPPAATPAAPPVLGAVAAERIARVLDAQQAASPRTVSHLTLRVERAEGGDDRIRLDLRGRAVEARIDVADLGAADHLAARTPELRAALAQHGLTTDDVRVRSAAEAALDAQSRPDVWTTTAASVRGDAGVGTSSQHAGDGSPRNEARDQPSRDSGGRNERHPDDRASEHASRDGAAADRRASDQRQGRRPPPDAYLDAPAPRPARRAAR